MPHRDHAALEHLGTATLCDAARQLHPGRSLNAQAMANALPLRQTDRAQGPAYTIRLRRVSGTSDAQRSAFLDAYDQAPPGCIVVVEVANDVGGAVMGDLVARRLAAIGVAGIVIEGSVRDRAALQDCAPPSWFSRTAISGIVSREVCTEVGVTVCVDGATIRPGDMVCADADGAFVVPVAEVALTWSAARSIVSHEKIVALELSAGRSLGSALTMKRTVPPEVS